jgi:hypothetical protein
VIALIEKLHYLSNASGRSFGVFFLIFISLHAGREIAGERHQTIAKANTSIQLIPEKSRHFT